MRGLLDFSKSNKSQLIKPLSQDYAWKGRVLNLYQSRSIRGSVCGPAFTKYHSINRQRNPDSYLQPRISFDNLHILCRFPKKNFWLLFNFSMLKWIFSSLAELQACEGQRVKSGHWCSDEKACQFVNSMYACRHTRLANPPPLFHGLRKRDEPIIVIVITWRPPVQHTSRLIHAKLHDTQSRLYTFHDDDDAMQ